MEYIHGVDYAKLAKVIQNFQSTHSIIPHMSKEQIKKLLLACGYQASGLTASAACRHYGFERVNERSKRVDDCLHDAEQLYKAIEELSSKATLENF